MEEFSPEKKKKYIDFYMKIAKIVAEMSYANRLKVGSILVKDGNIISCGWNGMPPGWDNVCEYTVDDAKGYDTGKTKPEVIHSEMNCLLKVSKSNNSSKDSTMFLTHAPCIDCAKQIFTAGINKVYFRDHYRSTAGLDFLKKCNIEIEQCD
jgi:dCMP deaminase